MKNKTYKLTKDIDCEWCGAKAGEPCKIQLTWQEQQVRPRGNYKLGTEYLDGERIHFIRSK